ncbi:alpha/beta hydrolase [Streptomyces sp. PTM05]|uniref:Alpha/beta hydrolase n=1 Tax=Streptantibioticus parmotrematis TaxID=2873249 RepID=A0ABS7QK09_9ACTN|nr:alpha/beta hydrolase [Streptantibioticus parmotrematis]MBY8883278.1 alpha/beta hydrolase [Streptantibioticus parmotrematis]
MEKGSPRHRVTAHDHGGTPARRGKSLKRITVLGAVAALLAGAVATAPAGYAADRDAPGTTEARGAAVAAARAAEAGIHWTACPSDWQLAAPIQCGWVTVPIDYARPNGPTIKLAVDRARSTGTKAQRQGSLIYNPGGPGGSGLSFPRRTTTKNAIWAATAKAYDFVGFDPRGVGHSAPVSCEDPGAFAKAPKPDPVPRDAADKLALRKTAARYADGCHERGGRLLPYLTTPNTARDMDVIRAALGDKKINYLGVSYGTYLGAVYATLFPTHVRRLLVDSVVDPSPDHIWYRNNLDQDVAFQGRWNDWEDWVARHDANYHLGTTRAAVERQWLRLRATAAAHPLGGVVGPAELIAFFQNAPYYDQYWTIVAGAWSQYVAGDTKPLISAATPAAAGSADAVAAENENAVYTAVECNDAAWPRSWATWDRDNTRLNATYPLMTWPNAAMNLPCATWHEPQLTPLDVRSHAGLPAVLIVQSTRDAATPYPGAVELHRRLKGSEMITERGAGSHGVTGLVNPCINDRVTAYFVNGRLDAHDVTCAPHATPQPPARTTVKAKAADLPTTG